MKKLFADKHAFVLGGSGGIGFALSQHLIPECHSITVHGSHDSERFDALSQKAAETKTVFSKCVCAIDSQYMASEGQKAIDIIQKEAASADILCVCFGPFVQKPLHETNYNDWSLVVQGNLMLPGILVSAALSYMMNRHWGRILLFGGTHTTQIRAFRTNAAYAAAKTALSSLALSLAAEYASYGITCNLLSPGFVETEYLSVHQKDILRQKMPTGRLISPECIAQTALTLLKTPEMNGVLLNVDAGWFSA